MSHKLLLGDITSGLIYVELSSLDSQPFLIFAWHKNVKIILLLVNDGHLRWRLDLSCITLKGDTPRTIPT
jgi:hypothetical protein